MKRSEEPQSWGTALSKQHADDGSLRRRKKRSGVFEETMAPNFPHLVKNMHLHIQEVQQTPNKINSEIHTQAHHSQAVKRQRTLKAAREQQLITYTRSSVTVAANLSPEIMEVRGAVKEREHRIIL